MKADVESMGTDATDQVRATWILGQSPMPRRRYQEGASSPGWIRSGGHCWAEGARQGGPSQGTTGQGGQGTVGCGHCSRGTEDGGGG